MVNIGGIVKLAGGVVLHCAEQYPHTASITTTANMVLVPDDDQSIVSTASQMYLDMYTSVVCINPDLLLIANICS